MSRYYPEFTESLKCFLNKFRLAYVLALIFPSILPPPLLRPSKITKSGQIPEKAAIIPKLCQISCTYIRIQDTIITGIRKTFAKLGYALTLHCTKHRKSDMNSKCRCRVACFVLADLCWLFGCLWRSVLSILRIRSPSLPLSSLHTTTTIHSGWHPSSMESSKQLIRDGEGITQKTAKTK